MQHAKHPLALGLITIVAFWGCQEANKSVQTPPPVSAALADAATPQNGPSTGTGGTTDDETEAANTPQQVSGAFLVDIGPVTTTPQGMLVGLGDVVYGAGLYTRTGNYKANIDRTSLRLTLLPANGGSPTSPTLVTAPATSVWEVYFTVPRGLMSSLASAHLSARANIAGSTGPQTLMVSESTSTFNAQPPPSALEIASPIDMTGKFTGEPTVPQGVNSASLAGAEGEGAGGAGGTGAPGQTGGAAGESAGNNGASGGEGEGAGSNGLSGATPGEMASQAAGGGAGSAGQSGGGGESGLGGGESGGGLGGGEGGLASGLGNALGEGAGGGLGDLAGGY